MDNFLRYFIQDIGQLFYDFLDIFSALFRFLFRLVDFPGRMEIIKANNSEFTTLDWVLLLITNLALVAIIIIAVIFLLKLLRRIFRFRIPVKKYDEMKKNVEHLQKELIRANYEKDRLLAMHMEPLTGKTAGPQFEPEPEPDPDPNQENAQNTEADTNRNTMSSPCVNPMESRFFRLTSLDNYYKTQYQPPVYEDDITLPEFCARFRLYAGGTLHLYYDIRMIRHFIASFGAARIVILQGISGTGKTSLPYAFGKFVQNDSTVVSVQPAWRERTELYGYFNEFTKKYTETDFLSAIYSANFYRDPHLIILDEMNIARVEYYFAEMLSILEMPRQEEWKIDVATATWDNDPVGINAGKIQIPNNTWFVGTINNDDSTFAVADKVYDRAIPIDLDSRATPFDEGTAPPISISSDRLIALFDDAKKTYSISEENHSKLEQMNDYLIEHFKLAFGNRIMKQLNDYVPCYMACGGTEIEAIDFMVAKKVLRKFESLNLGFMKDELTKFSNYLDKTFGKDAMAICKEYIAYLKKMN
ncbi:MAG: hypothetical protein IJ489_11265 [Clostridia bacterium]|nr:hypothetical protein [Clostridia bacterium]